MNSTHRVLGLLTAALLLAGCSTVEPGRAIRDPGVDPNQPIPVLLDPGAFPTTPQPPLGTAGNARSGAIQEGRRMGENTVLPFQVDTTLTSPTPFVNGPVINLTVLLDIPLTISRALNQHNFVTGFVADSTRPDRGLHTPRLMNMVLRMATPADAVAAAADLTTQSTTLQPLFSTTALPTTPIPIPGHPDTTAVTIPAPELAVVWAFTARGSFILMQSVAVPDTAEAAAGLVARTLDQQQPLIDGFTPTPADQLGSLPLDPTGVLARTLPVPDGLPVSGGSYGPHAALAYQSDPGRSQGLFSDTGVDVVTKAATTVYRARDDGSAGKIVADFTEEVRQQKFTPAGGITGLPAARCLTSPKGELASEPKLTYCVASAGRYAFEATGTADAQVRQAAAAQYLMLTAP
ncbi:hypothetical protein B1R94_27615 [Mycolicibacterium litorale]|nr:hypothetical protein B1R94_27615 [Mycolicibacterium litorale]